MKMCYGPPSQLSGRRTGFTLILPRWSLFKALWNLLAASERRLTRMRIPLEDTAYSIGGYLGIL